MTIDDEFTVGIAGLGLMGGTFASAFRKAGLPRRPGEIFAHDKASSILTAAQTSGLIDQGFDSPGEMLKKCGLVFLCLPPGENLKFLKTWEKDFSPGCLITDIGGTKREICRAIENGLRDDLDFIPGHPMAGREKRETSALAEDSLFQGKNYILVPLARNKKSSMDFLKSLIRRLGFSRIVECSAEEHDTRIAFTSQLCHLIAAALMDCQDDTELICFGGGSFEDLTRIARFNVPLWTELFLENRDKLLFWSQKFRSSLAELEGLLSAGDATHLEEILKTASLRREEMTRKNREQTTGVSP